MSTVLVVIFGVLAFAIIVLNLVILIAIWRDPLKRLRSMFSYLLIHLCICNFLTGAVSLPVYMYYLYGNHYKFVTATRVTHSIYTASVFSTFSLSIDRYKAIRDPIYHRNNSSIKHVALYILGVWLCVAVELIGFNYLGEHFRIVFQTLTYSVLVVAVAVLYFRIRNVFQYYSNQDGDGEKNETLLSSRAMVEMRRKTEKAVVNTCKVIVGLQIITWLPLLILDYYDLLLSLSHKQVVLAAGITNIFLTVGPISDPLVCIFRLKNFKESIKYLFVRKQEVESLP